MDQFNFLIDPETREKLETLARSTERSSSAYLRWIIRREWQNVYELQATANDAFAPTQTTTEIDKSANPLG